MSDQDGISHNISLYNIKQTSDENKEKYHQGLHFAACSWEHTQKVLLTKHLRCFFLGGGMFSELYKMFSKGLRISLNIFTDMNCVTLKYCYTTKIKHLLRLT